VSGDKISIIVLGYTRFAETTGPCLESLARDPDFPSWDVILVDNGTDETVRALSQQAAVTYPTLRLLRLDVNAGFAGGMNAGLRIARGDPIMLLNSDLKVPAGMIGRLAAALRSHPEAGLIAPVTNAAGNEQHIFTDPAQDVMRQGHAFADAADNGCVMPYRLDFCCVALSRKAYEILGGLDEAFGPGYFEDFDYSLRAKRAGFDLLVAENVFVYHEGSASFGRASRAKKALMARNRRLLLERHGGEVRLVNRRETNLAVLAQYAAAAEVGRPPPPLRVANRMRLAVTDVPKGPFKRWRYRRRVAAVARRLRAAGCAV